MKLQGFAVELDCQVIYPVIMVRKHFDHVDTWVFDLDNTLYPPSMRLFDQIEVRMTAFVMDALDVSKDRADHLRQFYWKTYGTTLAGLMEEHGVDPGPYLWEVHDIDLSHMTHDPALIEHVTALPGRRIVFTNGTAPYAQRVLEARGLVGLFDAVYGVEDAQFRPKPEPEAFRHVFAKDGLDPMRSAMFEDEARNLKAPFDMGMRTVHVAPSPQSTEFIHHGTDDLTAFLSQLV